MAFGGSGGHAEGSRARRVVSTGKCLVAGTEFPTFTLRAGTPRGLVQLVLRLETQRDLRFWVNCLVAATRAAIDAQNVLLFRALTLHFRSLRVFYE